MAFTGEVAELCGRGKRAAADGATPRLLVHPHRRRATSNGTAALEAAALGLGFLGDVRAAAGIKAQLLALRHRAATSITLCLALHGVVLLRVIHSCFLDRAHERRGDWR